MSTDEKLDRRLLLGRGARLAGAAAAVSAGTLAVAAEPGAAAEPSHAGRGAQRCSKRRPVLEVACLGETFRLLVHPDADPGAGELRGSAFSVEGHIYRRNTIPGSGFDPESAPAIGRWFCRGWFLINPDRPEPHVITTQEYVVGEISPQELFPPDTLASSGTEGTFEEDQVPIRSVIGGTGTYAGATGVVLQHGVGTNTTFIEPLGIQAPNFRFRFRLSIPQL